MLLPYDHKIDQYTRSSKSKLTLRRSAIAYINLGWPVVPLYGVTDDKRCRCNQVNCASPGKHPSISRGVLAATTELTLIKRLLTPYSVSNIGIATGQASGLLVLDVDPRHGGDQSLRSLENQYGKLPQTLKAWTGGGGFHLYFRCPLGVASSAGLLGRGLDVRAEKGYVVAPPSRHISGQSYQWAEGAFEAAAVEMPPTWLIGLLSSARQIRTSRAIAPSRSHAPQSVIEEGRRNVTLASICGSLLRAVRAPQLATDVLLFINTRSCQPPLQRSEVKRIAANICAREGARRKGNADVKS